eukprot:gene12120-biopygen14017
MNLGKSAETQPKSTVTQAQSEIAPETAEQGGGQTAQAAEYPSELQASYSDSPSQELPLQATPVTAWQHNPVFHALSANKTLYTPVHGLATESIGTSLAAEQAVHVPGITVANTSNSSQSSSPSSAGADRFKTPLAAPSPSAGVTPSGSPDRSVVTSEQGVPPFDAPLKYQSFREKFYNWQQRATAQAPFEPPVSGAGVLRQAVQGFAGLPFVPGATAAIPAASSAAALLASQPAPVASGQPALFQPLAASTPQAAFPRPAFDSVPLQHSADPVRSSSVPGLSSAFPVQPPAAPIAQFLPATSVLSSSAIPSIIPGLATSGASAFGFDQVMFGMDSKADDRPKWSGERGVAWPNFQQYWQGKLATVRAQPLGRSVMCSLSLQQEMVLQGMKKDSVGEVDARDVWECLQQQVCLAELGWFPPVLFPEAAITKVKRRQPAGIPVERILHNALQRCVQPMCQVAAAQSCALTTQVEIDHVLAGNVESPALQAVVLPSGHIKQATGFSRLKYLGRTCSPDQAVMEMFWILMHTMYAVSPQAEKEFYALTQAGSQGTMDIRAFASDVERRYRCVEFVSGVVSEEVTSIIVAGLNSQEGRKYGERRLEKDRQLSIDQLVEMLEERERTGQVKDLVAAKAARYGYVTGGSSSKSGKHLKADTDTGAQTSSTEMSKLVAKIRKQRGGYLRQLAKDNLPDAESIEKAIDYLITHPSHPKSLCISHWEKGNLHTKAECKSPDGTALAGMGVGGQQSGGQSGEGATGGLFRAPPKPPAAPKGKKDYGVQPPAGTATQPNTPCPVCQFPSGHPRGICFFAQPNMAADWWGGPNRRADPQVVVRYIEACAQQRVVPRLSRCGQTVDALLGSDSLSPQARAMLQQQFGQLGPPPSPNTTYMPQAQNRYAPRPMPTAYVPQHMATLQQAPMPMTGNYQAFACQMPQDMSAAWQMQPLQHALPSLPQTPGPPMASAANAYVLPATPMCHANSGQQQMPMTPASGQGQPQLMSLPAQPQLLMASSSGYVQQPQAFMAASTQPDPNQISSSSSGHTGPRGYGWCHTVISETEDVGLGAFAATRASTSRTSADTRRQPVPKSFVASDPVLPRDPNSSRTTEQQTDTLQEETGVSTEQAWTAVQAAMTKHELSLQQLTEQLAILNSLLPTTQTAAKVAADDPIALMASVLEGINSGGFAQAFDVPASSATAADSSCQAMMSETPTKQTRSVAYSGKNHYGDVAANFPQELLFQPPNMSYVLQQQQRQGLDRFCCTSKRTGLTLVLSDDREILLDGAFHDSGANLLLLTQALCKEIGLTYRQGSGVPGVRGWKGFKEKVLLGYTDPFKLVFAKGTSYETTLHVPTGYVVPGDAQGMYTLCLDKQTVFAVFGHVNPLLQHFCWYPWIAQGDRRHLAGIPIRSFVSASSGESVQTAFAFSVAREQLQRIHSLTGLEPAVPDLMDMQLERVAEATLETIIMMEPKTVVAAQTIGYLGHLISATECQPEEAKVAAIKALEPPTSVKRLQAHLGLFNYYRAFVPGFSRIAQPLYKLTAKDVVWEWTEACQQAFDELKDTLCTPGLALRQPDPSRPFHLFTDWSQTGLAAVLQQKTDDDTQYLVACASRSLNAAERNYPAWKGEMLAAVWGVRFTLVHRAGVLNPADVPSREPLLCTADSTGPLDGFGVRLTTQLSTHSCGEGFFTAAHSGGIVLWEPCGGLCAGLEMVLRNGFTVSRYLYSDTDLTAQTIALHRIMQLQEQYPLQLQQQALEGCFSAMPEDITDITVQHVHAVVLSQPSAQWFVVAGWPCQDFSLAGPSRGMAAARSRLLTDLVRLIGILQQLLPEQPPGYLLENVPMQYHRNSTIAQQDFHQVTRAIGQPVVLDAAQVGSFAHRLRNFWTNLCFPEQLQAAIQFIQRPPERELSSILAVHRQPMPVARMDRAPQYVCNMPGQARQAWPTIMSRPGSYAFRSGQPGSVIDCSDPARPQETEPTAVERELAMGYAAGTTAAFGVTEAERCRTLGQCMDANALQVLFALTEAIWQSTTQPCATPHQSFVSFEPVKQNCQLLDALSESHQSLSSLEAVCNAAAAQEQATAPARGAGDVWEDPAVLQFLQTGELPRDSAPAAIRRIQRRSKHYSLVGDKLLRTMPDASQKVVPKPSERQQLVTQQHERAGHPGKRKTAALLLTRFWWYGLLADSEHLVGNCKHCSRIEADFTAKPQKLQPIPISSLAFRWPVDLAGPLPKSNRDNTFIMIAVEAFTKHLEVVPIHNKEAATVAYAFLHHVIAKFGAAGQVVTDSGTEFEGRFHDLLQDCMIDHVLISKSHPQSNGQVERMVQTVKTALKKTCAAKQRVSDWDEEVAWIAMSYRCSPQSSTGFSPYEMLYGRKPVFPPAAADVLSPEISYADPESAAKDLRIRKETIKRICPVAMENLAIAQHRDQLRYLRSRDTSYQPKTKHFRVGDFVHVQQLQRNSTLQPRAQSVRIKEQGYSVQEAQQRETEHEQLAEEATAPVMFPNAAMKKRDEAAAAKHGRLVKKLFDDPLTGQLKVYWGRVHFRGALARPNYYLIMYEDGDSQTMSNRQLNPVLQEPNVTLPAGVHVPEPPAVAVATAVQQCLPSNVQHAGRFASSSVAQVPCCEIPDHDLRALSDMFVWQAWNDPITQYPGWVRLPFTLPVPNESWPQLQQRPTGVPVYLAPALPFVLQALQEAFKLKPVLIICYVPALSLPQPVWQLANVMINQGTGALLQAGKGWWLIISRRPVPSAAMRNEYDEEEILDYEDDERPAENALAPQEDEQNELPDQQGQQQEGEWPDAGPGQQQWERDVQPQSPRLVAAANEPVPPSLQQPAARMRAPLASAAAAGAAGYPRNPANNAWFAYYPLLHPTWNLTYDEAARDLKLMINEKEQVHVETAGPFSTNKLRQTRRNKWSNSLRKKAVRLLAGLETGTRKAAKAALNFVPGRVPASDTDSAEAGASSPSGEESDAAAEADQEVAAVPAAATVPAAAVPAVANTSVAPAVPTSAAASAPVVTVAPTAAAEPGAVSSRPYARYVRSELELEIGCIF